MNVPWIRKILERIESGGGVYMQQQVYAACTLTSHWHMYSVRRKKTPLNKCHYFQYISIFFYEIFRDYSGHNLPLLLRIYHLNCCCSEVAHLWIWKTIFFNCTDK